MPRAHRHFLPGYVWHITHRCHKQEFLLRFARDRKCWLRWLFEAKKRFGLCVLNYIVTSNHIHLLVLDRGGGEIAKSMQLIAGRTAQEYNQRKGRKGAFWEDRYHATAVDTEGYLARCLAYIDMNMVRAGIVSHPVHWPTSGYREIMARPKRYTIIDMQALTELLGLSSTQHLQQVRTQWVEAALSAAHLRREGAWSDSLAVGSYAFVEGIQEALGVGARHRVIDRDSAIYRLGETKAVYCVDSDVEISGLSDESAVYLD